MTTIDPQPTRNPVSPKVWVSTVLALLVPGIIAVVTYVGANQDVLGINNPILGVLVTALVPGILTFLGGYLPKDDLREETLRARRARLD